METKDYRKDFPILSKISYLDNAATSLTPKEVVEAMNEYYLDYNANVHRGVHELSEKATVAYNEAREKVAKFINADVKEIVFTSGTTESLNLVAKSLGLVEGDEVVLTEMEHHSNIVPWQQLGVKIKYIKVVDGKLDFDGVITGKTKVVSLAHVSNVLGTLNDVKGVARIAHEKGALVVVDGAQAVAHLNVDVKDLDCDFYCFSGHKMFGPTGIGVLYGKKKLLEKMNVFNTGGGMILEVTKEGFREGEVPAKFEAGTPNIAGAIGLGKAVDYISKVNLENDLAEYCVSKLKELDFVEIYSRGNGIVSFNVENVHAHDVATVLDRENVAIRAGHMCAMPLVKEVLKANAVCRASFCFYNSKEDVDKMINGLKKVNEVFNGTDL
tara:strand:- start:3315 stop:4463 length:1149 start_codon:yes stop_codon:yes gene_type:complete